MLYVIVSCFWDAVMMSPNVSKSSGFKIQISWTPIEQRGAPCIGGQRDLAGLG